MPLPSANSMDIKAEKEEDKKQKLLVIYISKFRDEWSFIPETKQTRVKSSSKNINTL